MINEESWLAIFCDEIISGFIIVNILCVLMQVSKSTSGAQTEEHPAMIPSHFTTPDVLMLDSYTQTNEDDRLSTKPILCRRKNMTDAQTDPLPVGREVVNQRPSRPKPMTKRVSFNDKTEEMRPRKSFDLNTKPDIVEETASISFELNRNCRHGNERSQCTQCNASVVHKKYRSPRIEGNVETPVPAEKPLKQTYHDEGKSPRITVTQAVPKDESHDSGQESDTPQQSSPRISDAKLAKIKHLARAKLKQIKEPEEINMRKSLDHHTLQRQKEDLHERSITGNQWRRNKPRRYDGVESWTLSDLPTLADQPPRKFLSTPSESADDHYFSDGSYFNKTAQQVTKHREDKRLADVTRAKNFIKHCIDKPIDEQSGASGYKHSKRHANRRDSGVSSLPVIKSNRRCESQPHKKRVRGIADDVESRNCVSEVPSGKMQSFDVNYKAYINALERIVDSNLSTLAQAERYYQKK